jgi:hypothetical protein
MPKPPSPPVMPKPLPPTPLDKKTAKLREARLAAKVTAINERYSTPSYPVLTLESTMPFGTHKGSSIEAIVKTNPSYITWLMENVPTIEFSDGVIEALEEATNPGY